MQPYSLGAPATGRRLHLNEFRFTHAAEVAAAVRRLAADSSDLALLAEYPTGPPQTLLSELAMFAGAPDSTNVTISAGSDEALRAVIDTCGVRGQKTVIVGVPTYTHFTQFARLRGLKICEYAIGLETAPEDHATLLECYAEELEEGALVYLGNPNNPTGDLWSEQIVAGLATRYPKSFFLIDEAYAEFAGVASSLPALSARAAFGARSLAQIATHMPNMVVTRTFSKAFGLAALRIGYAVGMPETIRQLNLALSPKAIGRMATTGALAVLRNLDHYRETTREALAATETLTRDIRELGWWIPSGGGHANFFLVHVGDAARIIAEFEKRGIHLRDRSDLPGLSGFVRISAGTREDCDAVLSAFRELEPPKAQAIQRHYTPKGKIATLRILLKRALAVLKKAKVDTWMHGGSLLGVDRHRGIIPWDDDIDLGYVADGNDPVEPLVEAFKEEGLTLQRNRTDAYWQIGTNEPGKTISDTHLDLFPFTCEDGKTYVNADERFQDETPDCPDAHCNIRFSAEELFPLREMPFYDDQVLVPAKAEEVLARALGPSYRTEARIRTDDGAVSYRIQDFYPA